MTKHAMKAALLALSCALLQAAEGGPVFQYNDQHFEPKYTYAFQMKTPDMDAMTPEDMQGGPSKIKWKKSLSIVFSDKAFDAEEMAKGDPPIDAIEKMVKDGAVLVWVTAAANGKIDSLSITLPRSETSLQLDNKEGTLTLDAPKDGKVSGRLVIKGDRKMHEFDPDNVPYTEADIRFVTASPGQK